MQTIAHGTDLSSLVTLLISVMTPHLMNKMGIDNMYFGVVFGCLVQLVNWVISKASTTGLGAINWIEIFWSVNFLQYIGCFMVPSVVCFAIWRIFFYTKYLVLTINSEADQLIFIDYLKNNTQYYELKVNSEIGDLDKISYDELNNANLMRHKDNDYKHVLVPQIDTKVKFDDKLLGIRGYFVWRNKVFDTSDVEKKTKKTITLRYVEIHICQDKIFNFSSDTKSIVKRMKKHVKDLRKNKTKITLSYTKVIIEAFVVDKKKDYQPRNITRHFYKGPRHSLDIQEKTYIRTFFHPVRDQLWELIKSNCLQNDLFKSMGQCGRVSLLLYGPPGTGKSTFIYRTAMCLYRNIVSLDLRDATKIDLYRYFFRPWHVTGNDTSHRNIIYLFEEFDISLKALKEREESKNKDLAKTITKDDDGNTIITIEDKKTNVTIRDLLELFQGPVPLEESIIIATTNKFKDISDICPELFRPGRMTPICMGYIDKQTLQEISQHFFGCHIKCRIPEEIIVPTSAIIDLAMEIKASNIHNQDKHHEFVTGLQKLWT